MALGISLELLLTCATTKACRIAKVKCTGKRQCERCKSRRIKCTYVAASGSGSGTRSTPSHGSGSTNDGPSRVVHRQSEMPLDLFDKQQSGIEVTALSSLGGSQDIASDTDLTAMTSGSYEAVPGFAGWPHEDFNSALEQIDWVFADSTTLDVSNIHLAQAQRDD